MAKVDMLGTGDHWGRKHCLTDAAFLLGVGDFLLTVELSTYS